MKRSLILLVVFLVVCAGSAWADTDASLKITGFNSQSQGISGTSFSFITTTGTANCEMNGVLNQDCQFSNFSGVDWFSLSFVISGNTASGPFVCDTTGPYDQCFINSNGTFAQFFGGPGIGAQTNRNFQISIKGWSPNTEFTATANQPTVPEPSALLLFGSGLLSLAGVVRRRLSL